MKNIRMAVIGAGGMGLHTAILYARCSGLEIAAFCDTAPGRAAEAAAEFNCATGGSAGAFDSYKALRDGPAYDAVYIACPPDVQVDIACREMERGIHVMTQVPAALTLEDCWHLVSTVEKTGVVYVLAEQARFWHFIRQWRDMAARSEFGKIVYAEGSYFHYEPQWDFFIERETGRKIITSDSIYQTDPRYEKSWRYKMFTEPILYLPHTLSPLLSVTGGRISKVSCFGTRIGSYFFDGFDTCDLQEAVMYNTEDILFSVKTGFTTPHGENSLCYSHFYQVKGTKATVETPRSELDRGKRWTAAVGWEHADLSCVPPDADEFTRNISHGGVDLEPILQFTRAIREGIAPEMDVYAAVETAAPAIMAAESCKQGGVMLEVPDFRPDNRNNKKA